MAKTIANKQDPPNEAVVHLVIGVAGGRGRGNPFGILRRLCEQLTARPELQIRSMKFLDPKELETNGN